MTELDRLITKAGGKLLGHGRHRYYDLDGERLSVHQGSKFSAQHEKAIRCRIRKILERRSKP